jgi:hypothetical protein
MPGARSLKGDKTTEERPVTDGEEIQKTVSIFSESGARRDWDRLVSMFTPEATWEFAGADKRLKGHAELRDAFPKMVEATEFLVQMNAPAVIDIAGDKATARSIVREAGKMRGYDEWIDLVGLYDDRLTRTDDGWRFEHRTFTLIGVARIPTLPNASLPKDA